VKTNICDRAELCLPVCQLLNSLGLASVVVGTDAKDPEKIDLYYHRTEKLEDILLTHPEGLKDTLRADSEDNNNDNDDNDNDNNNDNEDEGRTAKGRGLASYYKKI
jgi:hypothetical protein